MRKTFSLLLAVMFVISLVPMSAFSINSAKAADVPDTADYNYVRVKLISLGTITQAILSITGEYSIAESGETVSGKTLSLELNNGDICVYCDGETIYKGSQVSVLRENILPEGGYIQLHNKRKYLGDMYFYVDPDSGALIVVNRLPLAYYLYGVLAAEVDNAYPLEALKAQAVAAKCYALKKMRVNSYYDIRDTSVDQAYKGYNPSWTRIIQAVNETVNMTVTFNGKLISTYYSASNGGETNTPVIAWGGSESTNNGYGLAQDPFDFNNTSAVSERVDVKIGEAPENKKLGEMLVTMYNLMHTDGVAGACVRINAIECNTPKAAGSMCNMTRATVNATFAVDDTEVTTELDFDTKSFETYGVFVKTSLEIVWGEKTADKVYSLYHVRQGHGVGLSQRGAQARALAGHSCEQILKFYYPTASFGTMNVAIPGVGDTPTPTSTPKPTPTVTPTSTPNIPDVTMRPMPTFQAIESSTTAKAKPKAAANAPVVATSLEAVAQGVITASQVNVRTGPDTAFTIILKLNEGSKVSIIDMTDKEWYFIRSGNFFGYVSAQYVKVDGFISTGDKYICGKINADGVNFRVAPSTSSSAICKLNKNASVYVWKKSSGKDDWHYVQYGLNFGYIYDPYITLGEEVEFCTYSCAPANGHTIASAGLRVYPSVNAQTVAVIDLGVKLELMGLGNGWYMVRAGDDCGYVSETFVAVDSFMPVLPDMQELAMPKPIGTGVINATNVKFRSAPSTESDVLDRLAYGVEVIIYADLGDWYAAIYNGVYGYIYSVYVTASISAGEIPEYSGIILPKGKCTSNTLNFRSAPSTEATSLGKFAKNDTFDVIGECDGWYFIRSNDTTGYVSKAYVTLIPQDGYSLIEVNASWQSTDASVSAAVNMRRGPGVSYGVITKLDAGQHVVVLAVNSDAWCLVLCKGQYGFVALRYINID